MCALPSVTQMARTRGTTPPVDVINNMGNRPHFSTPFPHLFPPLRPHHSTHHILQNTPKHMFENTICCVYSNGGMPPVAPRRSTSTFKLTLRRFLRPFTCRSHRPQTPPPQGTCGPPPRRQVAKNGTGPRDIVPCVRKKHAAAIWSPSPNTYKYAGQRCVNDVPAGAPPDRPRSVVCDRHACRPAWSIYRHVPRSPVAHGGLRRPQAYG